MKPAMKFSLVAAALLSAGIAAPFYAWGGPDEDMKTACDHAAMLAATGVQAAAAGGTFAETVTAQATTSQAATAAWNAMGCAQYPDMVKNYRSWFIKRFTPEPEPQN